MRKFFLVNLIFIIILNYSFSQIPTTDLAGCWKFSGNLIDSSANGNNGSFINDGSFTSDRFNNLNCAIILHKDQQQYVKIPNHPSLQINNELCISFWVKRNTLGGVDQVLNKGGDWPGGTCNYGLVFSDWTLCFIYNGGYYYVDAPGTPQDYLWHHYLVTAANGSDVVKFYIDGELKSSALGAGSNPVVNLYSASTADLFIGGVNYYSNNSFDDIRIYKKILAASDISALNNEGNSTVDIKDIAGRNKIIIYPNPTKGTVKIVMGEFYENARVDICDINGILTYSGSFKNTSEIPLSIPGPEGIYSVTIYTGKDRTVIRLIKIK